MDLGKKVNIMIYEEIHKMRKNHQERVFLLREEITRLENRCKKNNIAYKIPAKKK